jgi:hypothetical protein
MYNSGHFTDAFPPPSQDLSGQQNETDQRLFMDCECPIWMYGRTGDGLVPRQSTGTSDLAEPEAQRASLVAGAKDEKTHGSRIDDCCTEYLASREHELGDKTLSPHKHLHGWLKQFCGAQGRNELTVDLLERFKVRGLPDLADTSKGTVVAKLKCFL